jgi:hypothetical protein
LCVVGNKEGGRDRSADEDLAKTKDADAIAKEADDWILPDPKQNNPRPDPLIASGDMVQFHNKTSALKDVIDETMKAGAKAPIKDPKLITEARARRFVDQALLAAQPGGGKVGGKGPLDVSRAS